MRNTARRAEFLAAQVAAAMGLDAVAYGLGSWSEAAGDVCSTCDCFCTKEVSYVPQALAFGDTAHTAAVRTYLRWNAEEFERYASMMVFDALICNTDRHLTNFGVLRNSRTGELLHGAPVFDNGRSLFFNLAFDQVDDFPLEARFSLPSWAQVTFEEQAARLVGAVQRAQLERLAAFEFCNSGRHPFPDGFLEGLARFVRQRAERLASFPLVPRDELRQLALR